MNNEAILKLIKDTEFVLSCIIANHSVIPDPAMGGTTDTASVPLDDVEAARRVLARLTAALAGAALAGGGWGLGQPAPGPAPGP